MNRTIKRLALPLGAAAILGTSGFAFMASNTFARPLGAGEGVNDVSGYNIHDQNTVLCSQGYTNINSPSDVCQVNFEATPLSTQALPNQAEAQPVDKKGNPIGDWVACTLGGSSSTQQSFYCVLTNNGNKGVSNQLFKGLDISLAN